MGKGGFDMFHQVVVWLAETIGQWGYPGIVMLMALESSFFPFPSEVVIPPAAYLAAGGKKNLGMEYISLPAGLSRMGVFTFCLATALGFGCWCRQVWDSGLAVTNSSYCKICNGSL